MCGGGKGDPTQFRDYVTGLCTLNEIVADNGWKIKLDIVPYFQLMRDLAKHLSQIKNALVIGPGNEKTWGIEGLDNASKEVFQALHDHCFPVLSGMPLYSTMNKQKGEATAWHLNGSCENVGKMAKYIHAAVELLQGFFTSVT